MHIHKLGVKLHDDSLMKIFMVSLEGAARSWYERLPSEILCSLTNFHIVFHEHFKGQYPSLLLVQDYCMHVKGVIENLENMYGDDEFMDEDILEILYENPFQKKEIQNSCLDIQENYQQLIISSLTERDTSQNYDSTNYISFLQIDDNLQQTCQSLCDQEGSWDCQSDPSSYYSSSEILLQEEASHFQPENTILQQQFLRITNTYVADYIKNYDSGNF